MKDIFICHASEDKPIVVEPLVKALETEGISCWLDKTEIKWGDSITQKVNEGLSIARYVIVVLSPSFIDKHWPQRELNAVLNIEASSGEVKVLPLLVGNKNERQNILNNFPLINDKFYLSWEGKVEPIIKALKSRLFDIKKEPDSLQEFKKESESVYIPRIKKQFSQRDRDLFTKKSFQIIKNYFQKALSQLEAQYKEIETDFTEVHNYKFISKVYLNDEVRCKCKIWIGNLLGSSESIGYSEGYLSPDNDNSYNEMITIKNDEQSLYFEFLMGSAFQQPQNKISDPQEAAEELWKRFIFPLTA